MSGSWSRWRIGIWATVLLGLAGTWRSEALTTTPLTLTQAHFDWLGSTSCAETPTARGALVPLPDNWRARQLPATGCGRYTLTWTQTPAPDLSEPWVMQIDRLSTHHRAWLNGVLVARPHVGGGVTGRPLPGLIVLPPALLRAGQNTLVLETQFDSMGGLSEIRVGPQSQLESVHERRRFLDIGLPISLNIACGAFAIFLVALWWRRRSEAALGLFGLICLIVSVRNCSYFNGIDPPWSADVSLWLFLSAQVSSVTLVGLFALVFSQTHWPRLKSTLLATLTLAPTLALAAQAWGHLPLYRNVLYPWLMILTLITVGLLVRHARRHGGARSWGLVLGMALMTLAGAHDYLRLNGQMPLQHNFWLPYAFPVMLIGFGVLLVSRLVLAMEQVEHLNLTLEERVSERTAELQAANAAKTHFLAAASHDLRQPVAAIGLITDVLHQRLSAPEHRALTDRLVRATRSMEGLLKELLDLSRLESDTIRVQWQDTPLQPLLNTIVQDEQELAASKGLRLTLRPTAAVVRSDPVLLEQILRNLVGNAIRHTRRGGVVIGVRARGDQWHVQIWDSGVGIAADDQRRIFQDFVQISATAGGIGLGLAIVRRATEVLGHEVRLRSRLGRGSCFTLCLPRAATQATRATPTSTLPAVDGTRPWLSGQPVLVVEDDDIVRDALREQLEQWGAHVHTIHGLTSLQTLPDRPWRLVITDHRLSDGSGLDVVRWARQTHPQAACLLITGDTAPRDWQRLALSGITVLHKPFSAATLASTLSALNAPSSASLPEPPPPPPVSGC